MLTAALFVIQKTAQALGVFLQVPIPLTDSVTVRMYDVLLFLFLLPMFIKLMYVVMTKSVNVQNKKAN